ncbi:glycosyltransferase family 2 protein [Clostridium butyricum]|uniref:Glycosyl transferase, group 2 family n=1 Tax=Clostridium butyricum E4 str. BoNT E BL5262 TaxID=632245 RepID=C4IDA4_CLOBU|nr:glycosyltransferase [Clostridium butyricum]APF24142.1 glycosyltransferase like 2 family protein [Clostridium butyricum]EDT76674.1 glycosyl transferase, group 2 family protein [Clostridium butyricum 5521]EEP55886.1 glycosyl transferase, group 2 family [Clostridium butyricum E4 str. BoNT E BL5262]NFL31852.1 glycosyltransferase [Clostridium butyricum]NFS19764.1 glycosyltransferase [Clostridium butyricum]
MINGELISVVIPVYNVEKYLPKCIESIINQTYTNLQIILVDDGSTDNSGSICDEYKKKDTRIMVIHKKNGGLSDARNVGIKYSKGKYIGFVDSDDYINKKMYEIMMENMVNNKANISIVNRYYVFEDGQEFLRYSINESIKVMSNLEAIEEMNNFSTFDMAAWDKLYEKELFNDIEFPVGKLSEDFYIMYLLFEKCKRIVYDSSPLYYYYQRNNSISRNKKINFDFVRAAKEQMTYIENRYPKLKPCMRVAYISANLTVYNSYLKQRMIPEKCVVKEIKREIGKNISYLKQNTTISKIKKIQIRLFLLNMSLYNLSFQLYKIKKRI